MLSALPETKWNVTTAAHLLNRAGFGGPPSEIEKLVQLGLEQAVAYFVDFERIPDSTPNPDWAKPDPTLAEKLQEFRKLNQQLRRASGEEKEELEKRRREMQREQIRTQVEQMMELRGWWLNRMVKGPRPLQEKMTLFWHGHFATSVQKVRDAYFMWRQNDTFRRHATGNWLQLQIAVAKDPAMLVWLDQAQSRKAHPNENYAREVMELFALGEGHYNESDVTEAARALTGWTLNRVKQDFEYRSFIHDGGNKTFLGKTGNLTGTDVLQQICAQPQSARFICTKLWAFLASENPSEELVTALAAVFTRSGSNFKLLLRAMFRSEEFYSESVIRQQVKSPVQWLVGSVRVLEREPPPAFQCNQMLRTLGQELFAPPNVKGWDGGLAWITTNNLLARYNLAALLVQGENTLQPDAQRRMARQMHRRMNRMNQKPAPVDVEKLLREEQRRDKSQLIAALEKRLLQGKLREKQEKTLREYLDAQSALDAHAILNAIRLLMSTPDFQLT
jgi:uncharacterized protein (DUF1800 family)